MDVSYNFPSQQLSFKAKTKAWRKSVIDWFANQAVMDNSPVRKSVFHKQINYDLLNGILHMNDLELIINPERITSSYIPDNIQHYPIMNSKLQVLIGEESKRIFDYRVIVTNPSAISEIETNKRNAIAQKLQDLIAETSQSEDEYNAKLEGMNEFFTYEWQDLREMRANFLLNHYSKEFNLPMLFTDGFVDALTVGEEIYRCDIISGEPVVERLNPIHVRIFKSGFSSKIEDADGIVIEDYWSPGRVIDTYHDILSPKDIKYLETIPFNGGMGTSGDEVNEDPTAGLFSINDDTILNINSLFSEDVNSLAPYDFNGNVRVVQVYWKSRRKVKKVTSFDPLTGDEVITLYPETYTINKDRGETEEILWINEAWEGTKIGQDIYVNMRPRPIQYNRLSNPSKCHFGIIGTLYTKGNDAPYSMVDIMKPYNYLYDVIHDRLTKLIAKNWGKIITLDLAKVPDGWDVDKWMYFAKVNGIAVINSFKEGNKGAATGKLAGALNNASSGVIDAELGNSIQNQISLLEYIKNEMSEVAGISKQREGQISNRETVGGVERATLQSSHITEWYFAKHDDTKKRVYECLLETSKIALRGKSKKFEYILSDGSMQIMTIDGDEFAEADYGLVIDSSENTQKLNSELETLAQAALQNQLLPFSTIMKIYGTSSLAEKQRLIERDEQRVRNQQMQASQQAMQLEQQKAQMEQEANMAKLEQEDTINQRDNETRILVATISAESKNLPENIDDNTMSAEAQAKLDENIRQFNLNHQLAKDRLALDKKIANDNAAIKRMKASSSTNKK